MEGGVAELGRMPDGPAAIELGVAVPGEAEAPVELDRAVGSEAVGDVGGGLGHAHGDLAGPLLVETVGRAVKVRPGLLIAGVGVDHGMLQRLVGADHLAELGAGAQVVEGVVNAGLGPAHHVGGGQEVGGQVEVLEGGARAVRVQQPVGVQDDTVEGQGERPAGLVDHRLPAKGAGGQVLRRQEHQGGGAVQADRDEDPAGLGGVGDQDLPAGQGQPTVRPSRRGAADGVRLPVGVQLPEGDGGGLAGGDPRQGLPLLVLAPAGDQGLGGEGGGDEGAGHQPPPHLLDQGNDLGEAEAGAAEGLRNGHPQPAEVAHLRPDRRVVARLGLHQATYGRHRRAPLAEIGGDLQQGRLILGKSDPSQILHRPRLP